MCRNKSTEVFEPRGGDKRKEDSKIAARNRRSKESDLSDALQTLVSTPYGEQGTLDKTSVIRLAVAYLKSRDIIGRGINFVDLKEEEKLPEFDVVTCLRGFSLVLGPEGDIVHVSNNVGQYVGLGPVELVGQTLADYIHPSDEAKLASLISLTGTEEKRKQVTVRMKCTVTEKGRVVNLNQASYKPLQISGLTQQFSESEEQGGLKGTVFIGLAVPVGPDMGVRQCEGMFVTKHSADMKFTDFDTWLTTVAGYPTSSLIHKSFFDFIHAGDLQRVQTSFRNLWEHRLCDTAPYRLLVKGGGYCWIQTSASCSAPRRGSSKGQTVTCQHSQVTEVQDRDQILATVQFDTNESSTEAAKSETAPVNIDILQEYIQVMHDIPTVTEKPPAKPLILEKKNVPSSLPTRVIVSCPTGNGNPVTKQLPVTSQIFGQKSQPKRPQASTSNIFSASSQASVSKTKQPWATSFSPSEDKKIDEEKELFGGLFNFSDDLTETEEELLEILKPGYGEDELISGLKPDEYLKINDLKLNPLKENTIESLSNKDQLDRNCFLRSVADMEKGIPSLGFRLPVTSLTDSSSSADSENDKEAVKLAYLLNTDRMEHISPSNTQSHDNSILEFLKLADSETNDQEVPNHRESPSSEARPSGIADGLRIRTPDPTSGPPRDVTGIDDDTVAEIFSFTSLFDMNQIGEICPTPSPEPSEGSYMFDCLAAEDREHSDQTVKEVMLYPEQDIMWGVTEPLTLTAASPISGSEETFGVGGTDFHGQQPLSQSTTAVTSSVRKRQLVAHDSSGDGCCDQRVIVSPQSIGDKRPHGESAWRPDKVPKLCRSNGDPILFFIVKSGD